MQDRTPQLIYLHNPKIIETWADPGADAMADLKISGRKEWACNCLDEVVRQRTSLNCHYHHDHHGHHHHYL